MRVSRILSSRPAGRERSADAGLPARVLGECSSFRYNEHSSVRYDDESERKVPPDVVAGIAVDGLHEDELWSRCLSRFFVCIRYPCPRR